MSGRSRRLAVTPPPEGSSSEWRRHWRVVAGTALGVSFGVSSFPFVASLFVQPLQAAFGWSRGRQALVQYIYLLGAFAAPWVGERVDRLGIRRIALVCVPLVGLSFLGLALMPASIWAFYALMAAMILTGQGTTGVVFTRAVAAWFVRSRGAALAASRVGLSIAAASLPPLVFAAIAHLGWRYGYVAMALVVFGVAWPATWAWVREPARPAAGVRSPGAGPGLVAGSLPLLRDRGVVILSLASALMMGPIVGLLSQLQPILAGEGLDSATSALGASVLALAVVASTLTTGVLADRVWAPAIGCLFALVGAAGCATLMLFPRLPALPALTAVAMVGIAQGAEIDLVGYLIARYFGIGAFARIFGLGIMLIGAASGLCSLGFGLGYDRFGDYRLMLGVSVGALTCASLLFLALGRYPAPAAPAGPDG